MRGKGVRYIDIKGKIRWNFCVWYYNLEERL